MRNGLSSVLVLLGVLALLVGYYWMHKPVDLALLWVMGTALLDLVLLGVLALVSGGAARRLLARLDVLSGLNAAERLAFTLGLGLGMTALLVLLLGLIGLLQAWALWGLLVLLDRIGPPTFHAELADWRQVIRAAWPQDRWEMLLAGFVGLLLLTGLLFALAPPTAWDALMYHLVGPQQYLADSAIRTQAENHYLGFPQNVEMLFTLMLGLTGRGTSAAPVHWLMGLVLLLAVAGLTGRYSSRAAAWFSVALLLSAYSLWLLLGWPYVDLAVMAYAALALVGLNQWRESGREVWLVLVGIGLGLTVGVKYTAAMMALAAGVYVVAVAPRRALRHGLLLVIPALLVFAPWLLKGLLLYQNPIFPYLFDGVNWDATRTAHFSQTFGGLLRRDGAWQLPLLPLAATVLGVEKAPGYAFTVGPWLLTLPLLLVPGWRWLDEPARRVARVLLPLYGLLLVQWAALAAVSDLGLGIRQTGASALPAAAVLGALAFHNLRRWPVKPFNLHFILRAIIVFTLALGLLDTLQTTLAHRIPHYFMGVMSESRYLDDQLGLYAPTMRRLGDLPAGSRVRFLWEPRAFYCPPQIECAGDVLTDFWSHPLTLGQTPDDVLAGWRDGGDDYLLVWETGFEFYAYSGEIEKFVAENQQFPAARERWLEPVWTDGAAYTLYGWRES